MAFLGLVSVSVSAAQDPEWFVKKDTKIETFIASVNKSIELNKKAGIIIPAYRNETTLPLISYPATISGVPNGKFRIDVSGVKTLYIGGPRGVKLHGVMLDSGDGVGKPIRSKDGTTLVKLTPIEERWMSWEKHGDLKIRDSEVAMELNGKYKWIWGNFYACHDLVWMDTVSRFNTYGSTSVNGARFRYDLMARMGWRGREYAQDTGLLPSVYAPLTIKKVAALIVNAPQSRNSGPMTPRCLSSLTLGKSPLMYTKAISTTKNSRPFPQPRRPRILRRLSAVT
jgi:hypothetical protein